MPTDLFGEPIPVVRRWRLRYAVAEDGSSGPAIIAAFDLDHAKAILREELVADDPEFFADGCTIEILEAKEEPHA